MRINLAVNKLIKPSNVAIAAMSMSFCAWLFPSFGVLRKGFDVAETLDPTSILVLSLWYGLIFVSFYVGQEFSATFIKCGKLRNPVLAVDSNVIYYIFTFLSKTVGR